MISPEALIGLTKMAYDGPAEFNRSGSRRPVSKPVPATHYANSSHPNHLRGSKPRTIGATAATGGGTDYATYGGKFKQNYGRNTMQNTNSSAPVQYGRNFYDSMAGGLGRESVTNMSQVPFGVAKVVGGGALTAATAVPAWAGHHQSQALNQAAARTMGSGFNDVTQPVVRAATMATTPYQDGRDEVDRIRGDMVNQIAPGAYEGAQGYYDMANIANTVGEFAAGTVPALSTGGAANAPFLARAVSGLRRTPMNVRNAAASAKTTARNFVGRPSVPYAKLVDPNALPKATGLPFQLPLEASEYMGHGALNLGPGAVSNKAVAPQSQAQPPNKVVLDHSNPSAPRSPNHRGQPAGLSPYIAAPAPAPAPAPPQYLAAPPQAPAPAPPQHLAAPPQAPAPAPPQHLAAPPEPAQPQAPAPAPAPQAPAPVPPRRANLTVGGKPTSPPAFVGPPAPPAFVGPTRTSNPTYVSGANQYRSTNPRRGSNESKSEFEARELRRYHAALERRKARAGSYSRRTQ